MNSEGCYFTTRRRAVNTLTLLLTFKNSRTAAVTVNNRPSRQRCILLLPKSVARKALALPRHLQQSFRKLYKANRWILVTLGALTIKKPEPVTAAIKPATALETAPSLTTDLSKYNAAIAMPAVTVCRR